MDIYGSSYATRISPAVLLLIYHNQWCQHAKNLRSERPSASYCRVLKFRV